MLAGYHVLVTQAMPLDSHAHSPFYRKLREGITGGMTAQARAVDEFIPNAKEDHSVSMKTFSSTHTQKGRSSSSLATSFHRRKTSAARQ